MVAAEYHEQIFGKELKSAYALSYANPEKVKNVAGWPELYQKEAEKLKISIKNARWAQPGGVIVPSDHSTLNVVIGTPGRYGYQYSMSFMQMPMNCGAMFAFGVDGVVATKVHFMCRLMGALSGNKVISLSCSATLAKALMKKGWVGMETWSGHHNGKHMYYLSYSMKETERAKREY